MVSIIVCYFTANVDNSWRISVNEQLRLSKLLVSRQCFYWKPDFNVVGRYKLCIKMQNSRGSKAYHTLAEACLSFAKLFRIYQQTFS